MRKPTKPYDENARREKSMNNVSDLVSYTFAAMAGLCFFTGIAVLSHGRG